MNGQTILCFLMAGLYNVFCNEQLYHVFLMGGL